MFILVAKYLEMFMAWVLKKSKTGFWISCNSDFMEKYLSSIKYNESNVMTYESCLELFVVRKIVIYDIIS